MKPGQKKKPVKKAGDIEINQPKITSFFVKKDPNVPSTPTDNPINLRQSKLNFSNNSSASNGTRRRKNKNKNRKTRNSRRLSSTKVIPESQVITISSSSGESSNEDDNQERSEANQTSSLILDQRPSTSGGCIKAVRTNRKANCGTSNKNTEAQIQVQNSSIIETPKLPNQGNGAKRNLNTSSFEAEKGMLHPEYENHEKKLNRCQVLPLVSISESEKLAARRAQIADLDTQKIEFSESDEETQDPTQNGADANSEGERSRSASPSLLSNCDIGMTNMKILEVPSFSEASGNSLQKNIENSTANAEDDFKDILDKQIELAFADNEFNENEMEPTKKSADGETAGESPSSSSASSTTRGSLQVTPLKNLQEPSTPTKRSSPNKSVKSKPLYFSPVRHLHSPSKKSPNSPMKLNNTVQKYFSPKKVLPNHGQVSHVPPQPGTSSSSSHNQASADITKPSFSMFLPYYLENFLEVLDAVSSDEHHFHLFTEEDFHLIGEFHKLSTEAKSLYVRLFQRKWIWRPSAKVSYPKIAENLQNYFDELHSKGFLLNHNSKEAKEQENLTLDELLSLMSGDQISILAREMGLKLSSKTKESCMEALIKLTKNQKTLCGSSSDIIFKAACKLLGPMYKVSTLSKNLFARMFILFSPPQYWEEESDQGSNQLLTSLLTKVGKMRYPAYRISKSIKIYQTREDLIRFQEAWSKHADIQAYCDPKVKDWESGKVVCEEAIEEFKKLLETDEIKSHDQTLPSFLRAFTAGSLLSRTIWMGIEAYQKTKDHAPANKIIEFLLSQTLYSPHYRGRWWERYIINMKHLKFSIDDIRKTIMKTLEDKSLQDSHRLGLHQKLEKLRGKPNDAKGKRKANSTTAKRKSKRARNSRIVESSDSEDEEQGPDPNQEVAVPSNLLKHEIPTRVLEGEKMTLDDNRGKSVFIGPNSATSTTGNSASSVEGFAIEWYKNGGYDYGIHGEGSVPVALFGLLFWEIIYHDEIPDVFHSPYQSYPLDIHFEDFYHQRRDLIEALLQNLKERWAVDDALKIIEKNWEDHYEMISIINWSVFGTVEEAKGLVRSMGLNVLAAICERLSKNFRYYRSGFPDLVLWNPSQCIFVEVKGPGDTLSSKQSLWLDYLVSIEANVEVCLVKSVSNKRIRIEA